MLETWEIRWFGKGAVPLRLQQWSAGMDFIAQPVRSDHYLIHQGGKMLGIKWREGNIQLKQRIGKNKENNIEHYQKWSFKLADDQAELALKQHEEWPRITKKREMLKWKIDNGRFERIDSDIEVDFGCEIELSAVILNEILWWTLAYEATGSEEILVKTLNNFEPPLPEERQRMGYAEWIANNCI